MFRRIEIVKKKEKLRIFMGMGRGTGVPKKKSMHDIYTNYQKKDSLHEKLEKEGFTKTIMAVRRTDKKGLLNMLNSYSKGCYKIAIVDGSEIGAKPKYLPKNLNSYYVVYVKDTRKNPKP